MAAATRTGNFLIPPPHPIKIGSLLYFRAINTTLLSDLFPSCCNLFATFATKASTGHAYGVSVVGDRGGRMSTVLTADFFHEGFFGHDMRSGGITLRICRERRRLHRDGLADYGFASV